MIRVFHCGDFAEIISLVIYESLKSCGIECTLSRDVNSFPDDLWILFCYKHGKYNIPTKYIVYQTEPAIQNTHGPYLDFLKNAYMVWEYSLLNIQNCNMFKNHIHVPFRYSPCLENWNNVSDSVDKDIDVLFIGHMTNYRKEIIGMLKNQGIEICCPHVFKKEREMMIKRAKINLVLHANHRNQKYPQDISRIFTLGSKKGFIISEPLEGCIIESIIQTSIPKMAETIKYYLSNEEQRLKITEMVYNEVVSHRMDDIIKDTIDFDTL